MVGRTGSGCSGRLRRLARRDVDSACGQLSAEPDAPSRRDGDPEACRYQNTRNTCLQDRRNAHGRPDHADAIDAGDRSPIATVRETMPRLAWRQAFELLAPAEKQRVPQHPTRHHAPAHYRGPRTHF